MLLQSSWQGIAALTAYRTNSHVRHTILTYLACRARYGYFWGSRETIAKECNCSLRAASEMMQDLEAIGAISLIPHDDLPAAIRKHIEKYYPLQSAKKVWLLNDSYTINGVVYQYLYTGDGGDNSNVTLRNNYNSSPNIESIKEIKNKKSAPISPPADVPKTSTVANAPVGSGSQSIPLESEQVVKATKTKPQSTWFSLTLNQAKQAGLYMGTDALRQRFEGQHHDPAKIKPYWELMARMIAHNDVGGNWRAYIAGLQGGALKAFNNRVKNTCLAYEAYSDTDNPITVDELAFYITYWIEHYFHELAVDDRKFPVSNEAVANNITKLRFAYQQATNSVKAK